MSRRQVNLLDWLSFHTLWISLIFLVQSHFAMEIHQLLKVSSDMLRYHGASRLTHIIIQYWPAFIATKIGNYFGGFNHKKSLVRQLPSYIFPSCQQHRNLIFWFPGSLICWFVHVRVRVSLIFIDSFICWLIDSLTRWFTASLVHWFIDSLIHWFVDSLIQ